MPTTTMRPRTPRTPRAVSRPGWEPETSKEASAPAPAVHSATAAGTSTRGRVQDVQPELVGHAAAVGVDLEDQDLGVGGPGDAGDE